MNEEILEELKERETRISFLENKIESLLAVLQSAQDGDMEAAKESAQPVEKPEQYLLNGLLDNLEHNLKNEQTYHFLKVLLGSMPIPVFIKDHKSRYTVISKHKAYLFGLKESEIIGKTDSDFVKNPKELEIIRQSDEEVLIKRNIVELPNQRFSLPNGSYIMKTHKIPFVNPITQKVNILGISKDVTDEINLRQVLFNPYS